MSASVHHKAVPEMHHVQTAATASSSIASSHNNTKVSMFKGKAGFVIPKNKFSGSLVPAFRGGKKSENSDAATEENTKQLQRNSKWGPDLTQDPAVRKGRALAYQTRVDQITQQLKLGSLGGNGQNSQVAGGVQDREPTKVIDYEKLKSLELERREVIGEILKLNPSYKVPSDYEPVTREATVPILEHPGFNFISLLYGPDGDTYKRLEKETGTKMQVYGINSETQEKVEITASDRSEALSSFDELYVQIAADTYEKVDAAAALLELLLSSVPGKSAPSKASDSESRDKMLVLSDSQDLDTISAVSTAMEATMGPMSTSSQGPFQQFQGSWFPTRPPNMPSGVAPAPSSMTFPFHPSPFAPRPHTQYGFGSPQNIQVGPPRSHPPLQGMQGPSMPPSNPFGQAGPPRNLSIATSPSPLMGHPAVNSPGWALPPSGGPQSMPPGSLVSPLGSSQSSAPSATPQRFPSQGGPTSATSFVPVQSFAPQASLRNQPVNILLRPGGQVSTPPPPPSRPPSGMLNPNVGPLNAPPSFTPLNPMGGPTPTPRSLLPNSNDFTFLPQRPQAPPQSASGHGMHFASQRAPPAQLPPAPQPPSFCQNTMPQHVGQNFPRPQMGPHPGGQFGPPSPNPQMGPRNLGPGPHQMLNQPGPFPPRMGHSPQYHQQRHPAPPLGQPGGPFVTNQHHPNSSGRPQVYDPFAPTSARGNNISASRKQESDPEYEDLMASVGVK